MNKISILIVVFVSTAATFAAGLDLIPWPAHLQSQAGAFFVTPQTVVTADLTFANEAMTLAGDLRIKTSPAAKTNLIHLTTAGAAGLGEESYRLEVDQLGVTIHARTTAGIFYAGRTLHQLLDQHTQQIPFVTIEDSPRYAWRGMMLDVSRHFFDQQTIFRLLDSMADYKLNRFHLHLTDDPAWRMEVEKYPELTKLGAVGNYSDSNSPARYFTKSELQEIVKYAAARHIVVVPEIDMPGHASAATRTFPQLNGGGNTFNPANEATYDFLQNVLKETMEIFPSPWIHFGGDEVKTKTWDQNPETAKKMAEEGLKNTHDLEGYFVRRISKFIADQGRTPAGWDEITAAGVNTNTVIYWWRHDRENVLKQSLATGYNVVLTPRAPCYLDYPQDKTFPSPWAWKLWNTTEDVYRGPLIPKGLLPGQSQHILGVEGCVWTERIGAVRYLEFMILPRMVALAEMAWTPDSERGYSKFNARLKPLLNQYRQSGIHFYDENNPEASLRETGVAVKSAAPANRKEEISSVHGELIR